MNLARAVASIGGFTMLSRIAGFARDMVIAAVAGTGPVADAFFIAFKLPNFFRRLFAEGAFNFAFVPLFAGALETGGTEAARQFAREAQAALLAVLLPLSAVLIAAMPYVVTALAPGLHDRPQTFDLAVDFSRITFPYLLFISLVSLQGGVLNSLGLFGQVAATPILLNLALIAAALGLTSLLPNAGYALAWGLFAAGVLQYLWLLAACWRAGMALPPVRPRLSPRVRRLAVLMWPAAIGGGAQQINSMLDVVWASFLPSGAISFLYYADRINQLPLGVVGVAIGTALLPLLSRQIKAGSIDAALANQNRAIEFALLLTLPATAGLIALHEPMIRVLFQRGAFGPEATIATANALIAFALGLPAFVLVKVLAPGFYAREDTRTPLYVALAAIGSNIVLNLALIGPLQHVGIALASSLSGWLNVLALGTILHRRGHLRVDAQLRRRAPAVLVAAIVMGGALFAALPLLDTALAARLPVAAATLAGLVLAGMAIYAVAVLLGGGARVADLTRGLKRPAGARPKERPAPDA